jgi:hypothetical protein
LAVDEVATARRLEAAARRPRSKLGPGEAAAAGSAREEQLNLLVCDQSAEIDG